MVSDEPGKLGELTLLIEKMGGSIRKVSFEEEKSDAKQVLITFHLRLPEKMTIARLCEDIRKVKGVRIVRSE
jgi:putative Mg2+ transporter-C (MgtC) family protein